jgi:hypothetical protein
MTPMTSRIVKRYMGMSGTPWTGVGITFTTIDLPEGWKRYEMVYDCGCQAAVESQGPDIKRAIPDGFNYRCPSHRFEVRSPLDGS